MTCSASAVSDAVLAGLLAPETRGQRTEIVAVGIPAIAWISHSTQTADHAGGDTNGVAQ